MDLIRIYQCLCDPLRLRILHLLTQGPLCVCHFQKILAQPQVRISKHLAYLKEKGLVEARRHQNWMIYCLPPDRTEELDKNLRCLQDCVQSDPVFREDLRSWQTLACETQWIEGALSCSPQKTAEELPGRLNDVTRGIPCR